MINKWVFTNISSHHDIDANVAKKGSLIEKLPKVYVKETVKLIKDWIHNYEYNGNPIDEDKYDDSTEDDGNTEEE